MVVLVFSTWKGYYETYNYLKKYLVSILCSVVFFIWFKSQFNEIIKSLTVWDVKTQKRCLKSLFASRWGKIMTMRPDSLWLYSGQVLVLSDHVENIVQSDCKWHKPVWTWKLNDPVLIYFNLRWVVITVMGSKESKENAFGSIRAWSRVQEYECVCVLLKLKITDSATKIFNYS